MPLPMTSRRRRRSRGAGLGHSCSQGLNLEPPDISCAMVGGLSHQAQRTSPWNTYSPCLDQFSLAL